MIYLIGGAPRVGKSILAQRFINQKPIPSFSCDFMYDTNDITSTDEFKNADIIEKGELYYPILQKLISNIERQSEHCLIDGEVILPRHARELSNQFNIRSCFLGLSATTMEMIVKNGGHFNWVKYKLENNLNSDVDGLVERTIARSKIIEKECKMYGVPYFDLATDYESLQNNALETLLG